MMMVMMITAPVTAVAWSGDMYIDDNDGDGDKQLPVTAVAWSGDMYIDDDDGDGDNSSCDSCCTER